MKKLIVVLFLLITAGMITMTVHAQSSALYLMPSFQFYSYPNLNQHLRAAGLPEVAATFGSGAGGFGTINERWRVGGEGTYFTGANTSGTTSTAAEGGLGLFYAGYVLTKNKWRWVPQAGIGYGGLAVTTTQLVNGSISDLLSTGSNSTRLENGSAFAHTGLSIERTVSDGLFLGLKGAYNFGLSDSAWDAPGLNPSTSDRFSGFVVNLIIGFNLR